MRTLITWIGKSDLKAAKQNDETCTRAAVWAG